MINVDETNGQHTATLTQRELATLRVIGQQIGSVAGDVLTGIAGDCGNDNCEACSLDGGDAHDVRYAVYGE